MNFTRRGELASKQISKCQITDKKTKVQCTVYTMNIFGSQVGYLYIAKFSLFLPQIVTILDEFFRVLQLALFTLKNVINKYCKNYSITQHRSYIYSGLHIH